MEHHHQAARAKAMHFRHHPCRVGFSPSDADRGAAKRGRGLYPRLFRPFPRDSGLYGAHQENRLPSHRLCRTRSSAGKCFIPGIRDANPARRAGAERQAINAPLQGSAAERVERAMARIPAALVAEGCAPACGSTTSCCSRRRKPRPNTLSGRRQMEGACAPHCDSRCPSSSKPAGREAGRGALEPARRQLLCGQFPRAG